MTAGVRVGVTLPQFTDDPRIVVDAARRAEAAGLDSAFVFDHLWPLDGPKRRPILECFTTLAHVAAATERITVGTLVARSTLRNPALLAAMTATVAAIAPGRVVLGVGSGDAASQRENEAYGLPYHSGRDRVAQLASTIRVVRAHLRADVAEVVDRFAAVRGLPPSPIRFPAPPVWVAGRGAATMDLAARVADGWNAWGVPAAEFAACARRVRRVAAGRPVELTWAGIVTVGSPDEASASLGAIVAAGATHVVCTSPYAARVGVYERLGGEVAPRVRVAGNTP